MRRMVVRSAWCLVLAIGCHTNAKTPAPSPQNSLPCTPAVHDGAAVRRGEPLFEGYRFLGASPDGKRVALMLTHMGPGSGQPVGGAHVIEAGAAKEVLAKSYFKIAGTEAELPQVERGIPEAFASDLAAVGVTVGEHLPVQQAWCADPAGTIYTVRGAALDLRVTRTPCENDPKHQAAAWQVCTKDGASCASGGATGCLDGQIVVHDVLRAADVDWIVVDMVTRPFPDIEFHLFQTGGAVLSGS